jgi:hypothetical protein
MEYAEFALRARFALLCLRPKLAEPLRVALSKASVGDSAKEQKQRGDQANAMHGPLPVAV